VADSTVKAHYTASPEDAWRLVGDFAGIAGVFTAIEDVTIQGDDRTFTMLGMRITERLVRRDEASRTLTYSIIDGVPIESHEATIRVDAAEGGCDIVWSVTTVPEDAEPLFTDTYQRALDSLHGTFDTP